MDIYRFSLWFHSFPPLVQTVMAMACLAVVSFLVWVLINVAEWLLSRTKPMPALSEKNRLMLMAAVSESLQAHGACYDVDCSNPAVCRILIHGPNGPRRSIMSCLECSNEVLEWARKRGYTAETQPLLDAAVALAAEQSQAAESAAGRIEHYCRNRGCDGITVYAVRAGAGCWHVCRNCLGSCCAELIESGNIAEVHQLPLPF